jgi:CheY-like chemotaxis protein
MTNSRTVLVVEDEFLVRLAMCEAFTDAGFEVLQAESGERAVEILGDGPQIDVLFTDIGLGGALTGWDVGERARAGRSEIQVIYASGNPNLPDRNVSGSQFFQKPYLTETIVTASFPPSG